MKYICKNCDYRFESSLDQSKRSCPYCGMKGIVEEPNADELLNDFE